MNFSATANNEEARLAALARYHIVDTPAEACFDRLTTLLSQTFQAPLAQLNFVDRERVWSKSCRDQTPGSVPREQSICSHTILSDEVMVVPDLLEDSRFFDNPYVVGPPYLRSYAGAPLKTSDGFRLGAIAVCDFAPRRHLDSQRLAALEVIAEVAMDELDQRLAAWGPAEPVQAGTDWNRIAFESPSVSLAIFDSAGKCVEVSPAYCRMCGYGRSELIGQSFLMLLPPEARERAGRIHDAVLSGSMCEPAETLLLRKDGRRVAAYVVHARITHLDKVYCLSSFVDVTEIKQAEEQIRRSQKLEAVRRLAGGVAHNINNLLTVIIGYSQIMADSLEPSDPRKRYSLEISAAGQRAALITGQLLTFSRHGVVCPRLVDLNPAVGGCEKELREILGDNVVFRSILRPEVGKIQAGTGQVEQALRHLAINAKQAMPDGGSFLLETNRIELDADYAQLHPGIHPGEYALITVTDTGCGMDEETRSHLFEPFFTTKGIGKGTGLAVVYGLVRQCGGDLAIYSEPEGGTTVGLFFPIAQEQVTSDRPETVCPGHQLLLAEDEPEILETMRVALESRGYSVLTAKNAGEALRLWELHADDICALIAETAFPTITGPELAAALQAKKPGLPVLYLSGDGEDVLIGSDAPSAHTLVLQKPFTPEALRSMLQQLLKTDPVRETQ